MTREYKDSGIEWIGQIPKEWDTTRIGNLFSFSSGDSITNEQIKDEGQYKVYGANGVRGFYSTYNLSKPSILLGRVGALCGNVHIVDEKIWVTEHALISQQRYPTIIKYYAYVFSSMNLIQYSKASAQPVISTSTITNLVCPIPDLSEQQFIADFLEKKCGEIDTLIALQEKMIEDLKAYKQSIITEAVTKGLNPNVPMKDSGIDWIGEVPEHWNLEPLKYCFGRRSEKNNPIKTKERLSLSIDKGVTLYAEKTTNLDRFKDDYTQYQLAYPNDIVLNCMNMIVGAVGLSHYLGCVSPVYYVIYPINSYVDALYYSYLLNIPSIRGVYFSLGKGIYAIERGEGRVNTCRLKVSYNDFGRLEIPIPPINEQKEITAFIQNKSSDIDTLISVKQQKIEELKEYKKSVIYEYVTGKKEVV
jgi:type I restriction enzyme S subunit